ncbi:MAG TPA: hypothetical protein VK249_00250, partial [Anaerolineales bacterium]|nr:hypothetical protein [Anaerolineales bacterium]
MRTQTRRSLKTLTVVVFFLTVFFIAFFDTSKNLSWLAIVNPFADDPYDAVGSFGIQLSFFAALLSLIRVFRPYRTEEIPPTQRLLILHGEIVALLSIMVTLAIDTVAMFRYPSMWLDSPSGRILPILIGGLIVLTALIGLLLSRFVAGLSLSFANRSWRRAIPFPISLFILAVYPSDLLESIPGGILSALLGMVLLFISTWALATALFSHTVLEFEDVLDDLTSIYQSIKSRLGIAIG